MDASLKALVDQLDLEALEVNLFRGQSTYIGSPNVFGGQVIGQAMVAATRTVELRPPHSCHAYFLLPGDIKAPIVYEVERIRDGKSFSTRRVQAIQHGRPILSMIASFQVEEEGYEHQVKMPDVPMPEDLKPFDELVTDWIAEVPGLDPKLMAGLKRPRAIDFRVVNPVNPLQPTRSEPVSQIWFRVVDRLPDDPLLHRCMLAFASDFNLIGTALRPHGVSWYRQDLVLASLDHAIWFHRPGRVDEWMLYAMDSPTAQGARGFARGQIFDRQGVLVASTAQEGLTRPKTTR